MKIRLYLSPCGDVFIDLELDELKKLKEEGKLGIIPLFCDKETEKILRKEGVIGSNLG